MKRVFARALTRRVSVSVCLRAGRALALLLASALLNLSAQPARASTPPPYAGEITVAGGAAVDGSPAASGQTVFSGSAISTAADSRSTLNLGALGRLELAPRTSLRLDFGGAGTNCALEAGRVRLFAPEGARSAVRTADAAVASVGEETAVFSVEYARGATSVSVQSGRVEVRAGEVVRRLSAGETYSGAPAPPGPSQNLSGGQRKGLIVAIAAAVAIIAIALAATGGDNDQIIRGDCPIIISPTGNIPPCF